MVVVVAVVTAAAAAAGNCPASCFEGGSVCRYQIA